MLELWAGSKPILFITFSGLTSIEYFSELRLKNHNQGDDGHLAEVAENPLQAFEVQEIGDEKQEPRQHDADHDSPGP